MPHRHAPPRPTTPTTPETEEPAFDGKFRPIFQNTYRLESKRPWAEEAVQACLREVLQEMLSAVEYEPATCTDLANSVAVEIRYRLRELNFDRYKILCVVEIYEKLFQGIHAELGYLWDPQRDRFATHTYTNTHIIATATVFGIYYD